MWSIKREGKGSENEKAYYLTVGEHLVGRKDCQIQVTGDQSVSRKHAWINVSQSGTTTAQVALKDISKFGCLVNDVKCQNSVVVVLKPNDKITFGSSFYRLKYEAMVLFASCLDNAKKKNLRSQISKIGGYLVSEWQKECSHLVMEALSFTVKVIYALVTCCPIVTPSYFEDLIKAIDSKTELPSHEKYFPPIKEDLIDPEKVSFRPNEARKSIFSGKLFLFLEKKQHKRLEQAITLAGGKSLLKENGDTSGNVDKTLTDENTLVISAVMPGVSEEKEVWIGHVGEVLKSVDRRPIAETEVGLAILHVSLEEYCNSSINHVPRITKHIVSKVISTMEEMSQRVNDSQIVSVDQVTEKKPFTNPNTSVTQDTRKRSRNGSDESQSLVFKTPQSLNVEAKRRRLSLDVTHISQTQQSEIKSPVNLQELPPGSKHEPTSPTKGQFCKLSGENLTTADVTHISQTQQSEMISSSAIPHGLKHISPTKSQFFKLGKGDTAVAKANITHVSQTQQSEVKSPGVPQGSSPGPKHKLTSPTDSPFRQPCQGNLSMMKEHITHVSQTQQSEVKSQGILSPVKRKSFTSDGSLNEKQEKSRGIFSDGSESGKKLKFSRSKADTSQNERPIRSLGEISHISQTPNKDLTVVPNSQTVRVKETPSPISFLSTKRRKISPTPDITHVSDTERSMVEEPQLSAVKVEETPSPEISFASKRRKVSSPITDVTHISDTERSIFDNSKGLSHSPISPEQIAHKNFTSDVKSRSLKGALDGENPVRCGNLENNSRKPSSKGDHLEESGDNDSRKPRVDHEERPTLKETSSFLGHSNGAAPNDKAKQETTTQDLSGIKSSVSPANSGWMSKRSFSVKKEKTNQNDSVDGHRVTVDVNANVEKSDSQQKLSQILDVKKEESIPNDVMCVEHIELVVAKRVRPTKTQQSEKNHIPTLKNMKRFRKQTYAGDSRALPRIIGGNDLVVFTTSRHYNEEWIMNEVDAMTRQDTENREADNLFRYEPSKKSRKR